MPPEGGREIRHARCRQCASTHSHPAQARVLLLSDGNANAGASRDPGEIAAQRAAAAARRVTTSTYGLGRAFNEELMVAMARSGLGNHYLPGKTHQNRVKLMAYSL